VDHKIGGEGGGDKSSSTDSGGGGVLKYRPRSLAQMHDASIVVANPNAQIK